MSKVLAKTLVGLILVNSAAWVGAADDGSYQRQADQQRSRCDVVSSVLAEKRARLERFKELNEARMAESRSDNFLGMNRAGLAALDPKSSNPWANVSKAVAADKAAKAQAEAEYQARIDAMENDIDRKRVSSGCN